LENDSTWYVKNKLKKTGVKGRACPFSGHADHDLEGVVSYAISGLANGRPDPANVVRV
jgi:hypothetical protein